MPARQSKRQYMKRNVTIGESTLAKLIIKTTSKEIWDNINEIRGKNAKHSNPTLEVEGQYFTTSQEKANSLVNHYQKVSSTDSLMTKVRHFGYKIYDLRIIEVVELRTKRALNKQKTQTQTTKGINNVDTRSWKSLEACKHFLQTTTKHITDIS